MLPVLALVYKSVVDAFFAFTFPLYTLLKNLMMEDMVSEEDEDE